MKCWYLQYNPKSLLTMDIYNNALKFLILFIIMVLFTSFHITHLFMIVILLHLQSI